MAKSYRTNLHEWSKHPRNNTPKTFKTGNWLQNATPKSRHIGIHSSIVGKKWTSEPWIFNKNHENCLNGRLSKAIVCFWLCSRRQITALLRTASAPSKAQRFWCFPSLPLSHITHHTGSHHGDQTKLGRPTAGATFAQTAKLKKPRGALPPRGDQTSSNIIKHKPS